MTERERFEKWFKAPLEALKACDDNGFAILMLSLPLLERFLRQKSGTFERNPLPDVFFDELLRVFPRLYNRAGGRAFWRIYRHGLLHQATLKFQEKTSAALVGQSEAVVFDPATRKFLVDPEKFADTVVSLIESDFPVFVAPQSISHGLVDIFQYYQAEAAGHARTSDSITIGTGYRFQMPSSSPNDDCAP